MVDNLVAPATVEPISRTEAKLHVRETQSAQDALVDLIVSTACTRAESECRRALVLQTRKLVLDGFPGTCIEIERAPLRAVQSIKYLDSEGALQTLSTSLYRVDKESDRPRITPEYGQVWPATRGVMNAVTVTYTAGYLAPFTAASASDLLTAAGHGLSDLDGTRVATIGGVLPTGLAADTNYYVRDATADTLKLSATPGGGAINITADGTAPNVLGFLPSPIKQAMLLMIGHFWEHREEVSDFQTFPVPLAADALLSPYRVIRF